MGKQSLLFWLLIVALLGASAYFGVKAERQRLAFQRGTGAVVSSGETVFLTQVLDGDTLLVEDGEGESISLRLVGIKALPSKVDKDPASRFGRAAVASLERTLAGRPARVELHDPPLDRHGRVLAYIFVDENDVGLRLVDEGLVLVYTAHPFKEMARYSDRQKQARVAARGLWSDPDVVARARHLERQWNAQRL